MVKIAYPKCNAKKYICFGPENTDAPGASPRRYGAPVAIVLYYLNQDFRKYGGIACAPDLGWGLGWRKGGDCQSQRSGARLALYPNLIQKSHQARISHAFSTSGSITTARRTASIT